MGLWVGTKIGYRLNGSAVASAKFTISSTSTSQAAISFSGLRNISIIVPLSPRMASAITSNGAMNAPVMGWGIPHSCWRRIERFRMTCPMCTEAIPPLSNAILDRMEPGCEKSPRILGRKTSSMKFTGFSIKRSYSSGFIYSLSTNWNWESGGRSFPGSR